MASLLALDERTNRLVSNAAILIGENSSGRGYRSNELLFEMKNKEYH